MSEVWEEIANELHRCFTGRAECLSSEEVDGLLYFAIYHHSTEIGHIGQNGEHLCTGFQSPSTGRSNLDE